MLQAHGRQNGGIVFLPERHTEFMLVVSDPRAFRAVIAVLLAALGLALWWWRWRRRSRRDKP